LRRAVRRRTINRWQLGARKPYGARLFRVFALVQIGFEFPFGERRIGEFGRKVRDAPDRRAGVFREAQRVPHRHDVEAAADPQVLCHPAQVHRHHQQVRDQLRASGWKWCSANQNVL
jgi:hypothetical protein